MQVAEHLIAAPAANQFYDVTVNTGTEERHGTCGMKVMSGYILGFESQVWYTEHDGVI